MIEHIQILRVIQLVNWLDSANMSCNQNVNSIPEKVLIGSQGSDALDESKFLQLPQCFVNIVDIISSWDSSARLLVLIVKFQTFVET